MNQMSPGRLGRGAFASAFAALLLAIIWVAGRVTPLSEGLAAASIVIVFAHAVVALGWFEALSFAAVCLAVTFAMENLGALTGFPFGRYAFLVEPSLPHIGAIPLIVGPIYFGMGYPSWIIANLLFGRDVQRPATRLQLFAVPVMAAFVMVQWDVVMDPTGSTLARAWVWYGSGGYFGVPLSNFLGWFLVTYLYFQAFAVCLYRRRTRPPYPARSAAFWAAPILLYLAAGLCHIAPLFDADARLIDAGGRAWSAADLRETTVIVMLFTMLPTSLLALARLARARNL
jgi:putative membrane protein